MPQSADHHKPHVTRIATFRIRHNYWQSTWRTEYLLPTDNIKIMLDSFFNLMNKSLAGVNTIKHDFFKFGNALFLGPPHVV